MTSTSEVTTNDLAQLLVKKVCSLRDYSALTPEPFRQAYTYRAAAEGLSAQSKADLDGKLSALNQSNGDLEEIMDAYRTVLSAAGVMPAVEEALRLLDESRTRQIIDAVAGPDEPRSSRWY